MTAQRSPSLAVADAIGVFEAEPDRLPDAPPVLISVFDDPLVELVAHPERDLPW